MPNTPPRDEQIQKLAEFAQKLSGKLDQVRQIKPTDKIKDKQTLKLLYDNIHLLEHPDGWIKHPYFQAQFSGNPAAVNEIKKKFCEAIVLLLQRNDKLKCPTSPTRKPRKPSSTSSSSASSKEPESTTKSPKAPNTPPSK